MGQYDDKEKRARIVDEYHAAPSSNCQFSIEPKHNDYIFCDWVRKFFPPAVVRDLFFAKQPPKVGDYDAFQCPRWENKFK